MNYYIYILFIVAGSNVQIISMLSPVHFKLKHCFDYKSVDIASSCKPVSPLIGYLLDLADARPLVCVMVRGNLADKDDKIDNNNHKDRTTLGSGFGQPTVFFSD